MGGEVTRHEFPGLTVEAHWDPEYLGPTKLVIEAKGNQDRHGVTHRKLRALSLEEIRPLPDRPEGDFYQVCEWLEGNLLRGRGGAYRYDDIWWANVALAYTLARCERVPDPTALISDMVGVERGTAHGWIGRARSKGFLTRLTKGHNGGMSHGEMTDKAHGVLREKESQVRAP